MHPVFDGIGRELVRYQVAPETRRRHERELLDCYLSELRRHGVSEPPTREAAFRAYRLAMLWGLVIGWLITPPVNYGRAITDANVSRMVEACRDLDPFELLPRGGRWKS